MAEFKDVIKKYHKMCEHYETCSKGCPIKKLKLDCMNGCIDTITAYPEEVEKIVMAWEKPIDWSKIEVDTKILVRHNENHPWKKRHFAKFENGKVYAWDDGMTSFTANGDEERDATEWDYAKLAEEDE